MTTQREKAEELRRLHAAPEPLVLVNAWDAASARVVAAAPGCRAIATASWSIAAAHGFPDGEAISREAMLAAVALVASAVELPVTADLERGYGDASVTVAGAIEAGAVGCNLEDSTGTGGLWPAEEHAAVVAAARAAGEIAGVPIVINARTDVFLEGAGGVDEASSAAAPTWRRAPTVIFVPGVRDVPTLEALVAGIGPISVFGMPGGPTLAEYARIGVARVSYGPGPMGVAMAALKTRRRDAARGRRTARRSPSRSGPVRRATGATPRSDDQRARAGAAGAAQAVRDRAVEAQRVALVERVDVAADLDLDRAAGDVDRDLARVHLVIGRPALAARGPLAQDRRAGLAGQLAQLAAAELARHALVAAHDADRRALARRRPQARDRDVQRGGDPLDRAHAGTRQAALDLAQEGM